MPKKNPRNLNALQLKTLALLQELARHPAHARSADDQGGILVSNLPAAHGDHFHMGDYVVAARDATGLSNQAVFVALERKGLIRSAFPLGAVLTAEGLAYDTGVRHLVLHSHGH